MINLISSIHDSPAPNDGENPGTLTSLINQNFLMNSLLNLSRKCLISLKGCGITEWLQGLITNDINLLKSNGGHLYTGILDARGRVFADAFLYEKYSSTENYQEVLFELWDEQVPSFKNFIVKYKLFRQIKVEDLEDDYNVFFSFDEIDALSIGEEYRKGVYRETRVPSLGNRWILPKKLISIIPTTVMKPADTDYVYQLYKLGICEGPNGIVSNKSFPFQVNWDLLNAVSFCKGCYLGQEFLSRTYYSGITRRRIVPLQFLNLPQIPQHLDLLGMDLFLEKDHSKSTQSVGQISGYLREVGVGVVKLEIFEDANSHVKLYARGPSNVRDERTSIELTASIPIWWTKSSFYDGVKFKSGL